MAKKIWKNGKKNFEKMSQKFFPWLPPLFLRTRKIKAISNSPLSESNTLWICQMSYMWSSNMRNNNYKQKKPPAPWGTGGNWWLSNFPNPRKLSAHVEGEHFQGWQITDEISAARWALNIEYFNLPHPSLFGWRGGGNLLNAMISGFTEYVFHARGGVGWGAGPSCTPSLS
jgi:hypothetical protein